MLTVTPILTSSSPLLSVLICSLKSRQTAFHSLCTSLVEQAQTAGLSNVELLVCVDEGQAPSGLKRHELSVASNGKYLAFVDDDDQVAADYLSAVLSGCARDVDVVTFDLTYQARGSTKRQAFFLNGADFVQQADGTIRMAANHLCAWRKTIARRVAFPPNLGYNDDTLWYEPLQAARIAQTECHISQELYRYVFVDSGTVNQAESSRQRTRQFAGAGIECFRRQNDIFIATKPVNITQRAPVVEVRNANNEVLTLRRRELQRFHIWHAR